jgi:hypothetical protein
MYPLLLVVLSSFVKVKCKLRKRIWCAYVNNKLCTEDGYQRRITYIYMYVYNIVCF